MNTDKYELANKWIRLQNKKISIIQYLKSRGIHRIVLYGASEFALRLLEQCENENNIIEVAAIADKKISSKGAYYKSIPLISMEDIVEFDTDNACVVITAMGYEKEIADELRNKEIRNYVSLRDLIYAVYC